MMVSKVEVLLALTAAAGATTGDGAAACPAPPPCMSLRPGLCADGRVCCSTPAACANAGSQPWCGGAATRPGLYVTSNPLRGLPPLPKPHYSWPLPGTFLADVAHADGVLRARGRIVALHDRSAHPEIH
jgi:hypothetical protein